MTKSGRRKTPNQASTPQSGEAISRNSTARPKATEGISTVCSPRPAEVALLATLLALDHNRRSKKSAEPRNFLIAAVRLVGEAKVALEYAAGMSVSDECYADLAFQMLAEQWNSAFGPARSSKPAPTESMLMPIPFKEVLAVKEAATSPPTAGQTEQRQGGRIKPAKPFGVVFRHLDDLRNREPGTTLVGNITTIKGLRKALRRVMPDQADEILAKRTMTVLEINLLLEDHLRRNRGEVRKVRPTKGGLGESP